MPLKCLKSTINILLHLLLDNIIFTRQISTTMYTHICMYLCPRYIRLWISWNCVVAACRNFSRKWISKILRRRRQGYFSCNVFLPNTLFSQAAQCICILLNKWKVKSSELYQMLSQNECFDHLTDLRMTLISMLP